VTSLAQRSRALFFGLVGRHLDHLYHFVGHRLAYARGTSPAARSAQRSTGTLV
jgi:hypothetical protein